MISNYRLPFMKNFFLVFLPIMLIFSVIAIIFFFQELKAHELLLKSKEGQHVETLLRLANDSIKIISHPQFFLKSVGFLFPMISFNRMVRSE